MHPLYDDEEAVDIATREHLDAGRTVFQLWQTAPEEKAHSIRVLDLVAPGHRARVLSLGCGIAGMEAYWQEQRPDLVFTLVNSSQAQLDLCQCMGTRQCCDAHDFVLPKGAPLFDVTILAYMLGHVQPRVVLERALRATHGTVIVLDVFDASAAFMRTLQYDAPDSATLHNLGFKRMPVTGWHLSPYIASDVRALGVISRAQPMMWVQHA